MDYKPKEQRSETKKYGNTTINHIDPVLVFVPYINQPVVIALLIDSAYVELIERPSQDT